MKDRGRIETGRRGEDLAVDYLKQRGYRIIERNYRCPFGEIDIVALHGEVVVFIEVKTRRSERFGDPQQSVTLEKQKRISRISLDYLQKKRLYPCSARFDVVAVRMLGKGPEIELIPNAFDIAF
jgi:putative endonuclease